MINGAGQMKIKVAGRIYDSVNVPVMIVMNDKEKDEIQKLEGNIYAITPRMSEKEVEEFKKI